MSGTRVPRGAARLGRLLLGERIGREFAKLWAASAVSGVGDGIALTAAPLLAFSLTRDPRLVAGVTTALTLPYLLFSLPAGVLNDRLDRRRSMVRVDAFRAVLTAAFTVAVIAGRATLIELYGCFFLIGACEAFFRNSAQALVPQVVQRDALADANGRVLGTEIVMNEFVGPMTGGLLSAITAPLPFAIDAVSFAASSLLLSRVRTRPAAARTAAVASKPPLTLRAAAAEMAAGIRVLWGHRLLRTLALIAGLMNLVAIAVLAVLVVFARADLHMSKAGYGVLLGCAALGGVVASRAGPWVARRAGSEKALLLAVALQCAGCLIAFTTRVPAVLAAMLALCSAGQVQWNIVCVVLRQTLVADEILGRVNSVYRFIAWGVMPVGSLCGGLLAGAFGARSVFLAGGILLGAGLAYPVRLVARHDIAAAAGRAPVPPPESELAHAAGRGAR
ncbi:MAG TPA: MFS transporter [Streptosporangiaceae bacterium]